MAGFVKNIIWNSVSGFVEEGTRTAGEYAGNALIKVGDSIENGGRGIGTSIEKKAGSYGSSISGQTYQPSAKPLPSTARKPAVKRSNSLPASVKPGSKPTSGTPLGANKYPGRNQVNATAGTAKKAIGGVTGGATKTVGGVTNTASGVVGGGQKAITGTAYNARNTVGGIAGGATKTLGCVTGGAARSTGNLIGGAGSTFKGPSSTPAPYKTLPKPFPNTNSLPKPNSSNAFPSSGPKTAVKPGQPKPFVPPVEQKKPDTKKPYPGTNTLPGSGSRTPVQQQKYKPLPRLGPQVGQGQKMQHIAI